MQLREAGMSWTSISFWLGVSTGTMRRRRHEFRLGNNYDTISDEHLDALIGTIIAQTPNAGVTLVRGEYTHPYYIIDIFDFTSL